MSGTALIDRIAGAGPVRSGKANRGHGTGPYNKDKRPAPPRGDVDGQWTHDMYSTGQGLKLGQRLAPANGNGNERNAPRYRLDAAARAVGEAAGVSSAGGSADGLSIRGAGGAQNVVQVRGLVQGTTAEDVKAIFQQVGPVTSATLTPGSDADPTVRVVFKSPQHAADAVSRYHGQNADGKKLSVVLVGQRTTTLLARVAGGGAAAALAGGSVDALMESGSGGSKMRSDEIMATDARAQVLVAPPGTDPKEYIQSGQRGGRGRGGRGRGRGYSRKRRGAKGGAGSMEVDA